ncbi:Flp pilus assembly protein TadD, contains TPR repeat [hydrothermal vent metagenome]|uniref:Flp pilus assembly protein TadD, contains TPR repeat n=1 Tax=hydrothermal vent metagenome TaxID=652676 RepID=A0A3B0SJP5_9ZZZZ
MAQSQSSLKESPSLQNALRRIARNSNDSSALADAGLAALALGDTRAAIGFLAKADQLYPRSGRVKAGLGRALLAEENPFGAIRYFNQAVANGVPMRDIAMDRGLAYDLIGRNADAQKDYELALRYDQSDALLNRYAISLGISGDLAAAEARLNPLLQKSDRDAWRHRAFILAMNGKKKDANQIARQTMQRNLAKAIIPFFDRMPKLTAAQKAAAVHYGHFPASENIGVDVASVRYAAQNSVRGGSGADAGLIPLGQPLGDNVKKPRVLAMPDISPRRRPGASRVARASNRQVVRRPSNGRVPLGMSRLPVPTSARPLVKPVVSRLSKPVSDGKGNSRKQESNAITGKPAASPINKPVNSTAPRPLPVKTPFERTTEKTVLAKAEPATVKPKDAPQEKQARSPGFETALGVGNIAKPPKIAAASARPIPPTTQDRPIVKSPDPLISLSVRRQVAIGNIPPSSMASDKKSSTLANKPGPKPVKQDPINRVSFDLAKSIPSSAPPVQTAQGKPVRRPLSEIIGSIDIPDEERTPVIVPVDLASITPAKPAPKVEKQKAEPKPEPQKAEPARPKRYWVQVATGSNMSALKHDFRQMKKKNAKLFGEMQGWTSPWGKTRRMVIGPFDDLSSAKKFDSAYRKNGGDSFAWVSKAGTEVNKLTK